MLRRLILIALGLVVLVCLLVLALLLLPARSSLAAGARQMRLAEDQVRSPGATRSPRAALAEVRVHIEQAHADFASADNRLRMIAPVLRRLFWIPTYGSEVAAAPDAAHFATQVSAGVLPLLDGLQPLVSVWGRRPGTSHLPTQVLLARLAGGRPDFVRSQQLLRQAQQMRRSIHAGQSRQLASSLRTVDTELPRLITASRALILLPRLLGLQQPQTYLVAYQDPAELRATGGFIGSAGLLTLQDGQASQNFQGTWIDDNVSVPPPQPVTVYDREAGWLFRDSNWSPDFPTSAQLELFFLNLDLHTTAAGVVNITPQAASDILAAVGPIYSPEYGRWITAANVAELADYYTHWSSYHGPLQSGSIDTQRKQFISIVAHHVLSHLADLSLRQVVRLSSAVARGVSHRDILLYARDPAEEAVFRAMGASGEIKPTTSDYLYVVDTNLSYNKINPFVHIRAGYHTDIQSNRWLHSHLTLTVTDGPAPPRYVNNGYGPGAGSQGKPEDYADFVRVYVPAGAELIDQSGWYQPWSPGSAYGKTEFCGYLIVPYGQTRTIHLSYIVPPNVFSWSKGTKYRLVVQHQPGSRPAAWQVSVSRAGGDASSWTIRQPTADWSKTIAIQKEPFSPLPLPKPTPEVVAPGHWIEPHVYLFPPGPQ